MSKNQDLTSVSEQISFKAYYEAKKQEPLNFRDEICKLLEISLKTFYRKLQDDSWSTPEMTIISQHLGIDSEILFPSKAA